MKILITGGRGFVGSRLCKLLQPDHELVIGSRHKSQEANVVYLDLANSESIVEAVSKLRPDCIIHLAAAKSQGKAEKDPASTFKVNYTGTKVLAEEAIKNDVQKMLILSSVKATYPVSVYGMSKAMMEKQILAFSIDQTETKFNIVRLGNILGSKGTFLQVWQKMMLENNLIESTGKGLHGFFIQPEYMDKVLMEFIRNDLQSGIYIPLMKSAAIEDFLLAWKSHFGTDYKFIETRTFDLKHEFLINEVELNNAYYFQLSNKYESPFLVVGEKPLKNDYQIVRKALSTENSAKFTLEQLESIVSKTEK